ncbi:hypothetical protein F5B19DRAFT_491563 [Rostrohypoxylon terebratum]|nr:hypothetical protein F5B19DRAFT_491563 [Rostrohypoxylon terebratum]
MPRYTSYSPSISPTTRTYTSSNSHRSSVSPDFGPPHQRRPPPAHSDNGKDMLKTSLVFLGVIGAASIAASRYWPKGVLYGEKEAWAREAKEVKNVMKEGRNYRRRSHDTGHGDPEAFRHRRHSHVNLRDEPVAPGPSGRNIGGPSPTKSDDYDGSNQSGRRVVDPRERRRFSDEPIRSREFKSSPPSPTVE